MSFLFISIRLIVTMSWIDDLCRWILNFTYERKCKTLDQPMMNQFFIILWSLIWPAYIVRAQHSVTISDNERTIRKQRGSTARTRREVRMCGRRLGKQKSGRSRKGQGLIKTKGHYCVILSYIHWHKYFCEMNWILCRLQAFAGYPLCCVVCVDSFEKCTDLQMLRVNQGMCESSCGKTVMYINYISLNFNLIITLIVLFKY